MYQTQRVFVAASPQEPYPWYRINPSNGERRLLADFELEISGVVISIAAGWTWDGPSVPRIARWLIDKEDLGELPALGHDYLYRCGGRPQPEVCRPPATWTRTEADRLFYLAMLDAGVAGWRARAAYTAVKLFGGGSWRESAGFRAEPVSEESQSVSGTGAARV